MSLVGRIFKEEIQMGTFNVKNFFGSMFTPVEDDMEENYYGEEEEHPSSQ